MRPSATRRCQLSTTAGTPSTGWQSRWPSGPWRKGGTPYADRRPVTNCQWSSRTPSARSAAYDSGALAGQQVRIRVRSRGDRSAPCTRGTSGSACARADEEDDHMTVMDSAESGRRLRCALFVDFDNVYIGLQRLDPRAAEAFASAPTHWLTALETGNDAEGEFSRRFLIRACYLNPSVFSQFRPNFTRAGFSVVDCPSLTQQGKSSADINLVLDAVDALSAETRYDEFVILSADADFTPLALRCRAADRRVTIITAGPAASAYRAVADTVITADELADLVKHPEPEALEEPPVPTVDERRTSPRTSPPSTPAKAGPSPTSPARKAVLRLVRSADRPLAGSVVAQAAHKADPTLSTSGWEGTGAFFPWLAKAVQELGAASR